jgi:hypothetical protein
VTRDASGGMPISPELGMARDRSEISPKFWPTEFFSVSAVPC